MKGPSLFEQMRQHIGATILFVTTFLGLVFMSVGVPLGVLRSRYEKSACYTMWGWKENCWNAAYSWRIHDEDCPDILHRFEVAEAFSVIALFSFLMVFLLAYLQIIGLKVKYLTAFSAFFTLCTTTVPWAVVLALYYSPYCGKYSYTRVHNKKAAGLALMITSFSIQGFGLLLYLIFEP